MFCGNCGAKIDEKTRFCPECGTEVKNVGRDANGKKDQDIASEHGIKNLDERLQRLEKLGVNHPKLINRAFTVWGYYILAQIIVAGVVLLLALVFGLFSQ
ncbi:MAG: hypothetical protein UT13_C0001G0310 [Candidatus Pacebacteria bacterium GW2011_GWF2_38_9]|nr:MAG: hypothetical protein US01_C0001G0318 [candidate division TM6 bacterium GW2011_GWF2_28_16]KKQ10299.1 MAG: hypothetical protein US20_C0001G0013 [Candidatus Pacebacteria bacterium GW2011_GWF1_36_5]KKQ88663.1 MAG: hypothetical protein UT13_C0001G0310 [Candidatus Pacebacteria bacterium GW2011_GWF2_38_9]HAZ73691.1 hypothetical protein [Candidatus Paceibacterota bacterium]